VTAEVGVLLPVRIETRFRNGDLWLRVIPDEPWYVRDDVRITPTELSALRRYLTARAADPDTATPPAEFRDLAGAVGPARAVYLIRNFTTTAPDGTTTAPDPISERQRSEPVPPRITGFPNVLHVWVHDDSGLHRVMALDVDPDRLLIIDPDHPNDPRWWEDWEQATLAGLGGVVPAAEVHGPIAALYVVGLGEDKPAALFVHLAAEGRLGLLPPGGPTNSVDGAAAASLATDPATWWTVLNGDLGDADTDVAAAITGEPAALGNLPGGHRPHRKPASLLVAALWPALWGFAASQVFQVARGAEPADWAAAALFPEGAFPSVRVGPQPYGLMPVTAWSRWQPAADDPVLERPLINALLTLRDRHAAAARARGTAIGKDTDGLLDLIADTPSSQRFRYRRAWPLELWWLASAASGLPAPWREVDRTWRERHRLADTLALTPLRRYGARGPSRRIGVPLVVPTAVTADAFGDLLTSLADKAENSPAEFADTEALLGERGHSLLLQLAIRSLQLLIGDLVRTQRGGLGFDPEPLARNREAVGTLQRLVATAAPPNPTTGEPLHTVTDALRALADVPAAELERMLRATIDCSSHRIDAWLLAPAQRRLDSLPSTTRRRLGAYGWVDTPAPGTPGPTPAGLLHAPTPTAAMTAAVLRDRAVSDPSPRWDLTITSRSARTAEHLATEVRAGSHLYEVLGREVERIVARTEHIQTLRTLFPLRPEHAGRRTCDGMNALAAQSFPFTVTAEQQEQLQLLRDAVDTYGDLLVADAVHHLVQGRADAASATMDAAAGLTRPPDLTLLASSRDGRAVTSSVAIALPHVDAPALPADEQQRAKLSPATVLDPSVAATIAAHTGPSAWDFLVGPDPAVTVTLTDLELTPADALTLTLSTLQRLAADHAGRPAAENLGGSGPDRYEQAAALVGLIGRRPATTRTVSEKPATDPPGAPADAELVDRYRNARAVGSALAAQLQAQVARFAGETLGTADETVLRELLTAATRWGIAPEPAAPPTTARLVLQQLENRLAAAPDDTAAAALSTDALSAAAAALISPTGQVGLTGTLSAGDLPALTPAATLDQDWLTVAAAVRSPLARLEAHQLGVQNPFAPWHNRGTDPWQTAADSRALVAVYAAPGLDLAAPPPGTTIAATAVDRFDEVVPATEQTSGAAFGFDAPAARAQQSILLAVPPALDTPFDEETLVQILVETRQLAHARMARPVDLDDQFWGLAPTGLLPATGSIAVTLEPGGPPL
jgi:hypothetical protein